MEETTDKHHSSRLSANYSQANTYLRPALTSKKAVQKRTVLFQNVAKQNYVVWFAEIIVEDEATRTFLKTLNPKSRYRAEKPLTNRLNKYSVQVNNLVIICFDNVEHVATTADSW